MRIPRHVTPYTAFHSSIGGGFLKKLMGSKNCFFSTYSEEPELKDLMEYLDSLKNHEKSGVPKGAGTDSKDGFDLGRMRRIMDQLGNPISKFKAIHIAGTKGKGSTAAFLSNILRAEGYSVGCYTRERMSVGRSDQPVSAKALSCLFHRIRHVLDKAMQLENGEEHMAALGGSLESIAVAKSGIIKHCRPVSVLVYLVLGGPFLPHIERIIRDKAFSMCSPVVSSSDFGIKSTIKGLSMLNGRPCQSCDIILEVGRDFPMSIELLDVKLCMIGRHQLQNAVTAACTALCLRDQGWRMSDESLRSGLENTCLVGRSQFLTSKDAEALGLSGTTILLDGAHTKESAKALVETIKMTFPEARLALVVAMASDKDHLAFAREFLSGRKLEAIFLTEAEVAGGKTRITSASLLRDHWIQASTELDINVLHDGMSEYRELLEDQSINSTMVSEHRTVLAAEDSLAVSMKFANQILKRRARNQSGILVVTGSLHIISSVLASLHK
ncbi:hypothetical protein EZV62_006060 [Acer yangbiense]|uniref:Mur ligase C-terminal domain-containing protein n=1 Tax=Acer yangbiense TaxID=1000413 RepID=A0A5C7IPH4_9ROSI|nr:hypothetical protein EZV62_006060 [Acer yangbiense]